MRDQPTALAVEAPARWRVWGALGAIYVIWGSGYVGVRALVHEFDMPPLAGTGVRFGLAGAALLAVLAFSRPVAPPRAELLPLTISGALLIGAGQGLLAVGELDVPGGLAALLYASVPLWVILLRRAYGERISPLLLGASVVGFAGVALLMAPESRPAEATVVGILLVLGSAFAWALGTVLAPRLRLPSDALVSTGLQMLLGGGLLVVCGAAAGELGELEAPSLGGAAVLVYLTVGSVLAFAAFMWLLRVLPLSTVATHAFVNPLVAVALGWALLDEHVGAMTALAGALILASVVITMRS